MSSCATTCVRTTGNKVEVWNGLAKKTPGGLRKSDLTKNKYGRIVSIKKMEQGRKAFAKNDVMKQHANGCKGAPIKPNCDADKGPLTYICGEKSDGGKMRPMRLAKSRAKSAMKGQK